MDGNRINSVSSTVYGSSLQRKAESLRHNTDPVNQSRQHLSGHDSLGVHLPANFVPMQNVLGVSVNSAPEQSFEGYRYAARSFGSKSLNPERYPHSSCSNCSHRLNPWNSRNQQSVCFETASIPAENDRQTGILFGSNSDPTAKYRTPETPPPSPPSAESPFRVLITYAQEPQFPKQHEAQVDNIVNTLINNGIDVIYDKLEQRRRDWSVARWMDDGLKQSKYVVVCISPNYLKVIESSSTDDAITLSEKNGMRATNYINFRIQTEFIWNLARNYRLVPVLISGAGEKHIPEWLKGTVTFQWPSDFYKIICRLKGLEPYVAPPRGRPPIHHVHYYKSHHTS